MKKFKFCLTCVFTAAIFFNLTPTSLADIIVVEGRLTDEEGTNVKGSNETEDTKSSHGLSLPEVVLVPIVPPAHKNDDDPEKANHPLPPTVPENCEDDLENDLCELDEEPEGYTCEDIGHGMELCEKNEDDAEAGSDVDDNEENGCSATGTGLNPASGLMSLLLLGFWLLRRNRQVSA